MVSGNFLLLNSQSLMIFKKLTIRPITFIFEIRVIWTIRIVIKLVLPWQQIVANLEATPPAKGLLATTTDTAQPH